LDRQSAPLRLGQVVVSLDCLLRHRATISARQGHEVAGSDAPEKALGAAPLGVEWTGGGGRIGCVGHDRCPFSAGRRVRARCRRLGAEGRTEPRRPASLRAQV
jgi:hypothetical protein